MTRARVLIADDHALVGQALRKALETDYEVVGVVTDGRSLVSAALNFQPDLVIVDVSMPMLSGLDAGKIIRQRMPSSKLVFLTMDHDPDLAAAAFRMGARGYLLKNSDASELPHCLAAVQSGLRYLTRLIAGGDISALLTESIDHMEAQSLTAREREVLQLLAKGHSMKTAAAILGITARTIAFHKYKIMGNFRLKSNAALIQLAIQSKVI